MTTQELIRRPVLFAISVWGLWLKDRFCNPIGYPRSEQYQWHGKWRVDLVKRRITRGWEGISFVDFFKKQRWFWVLLSGAFACAIALWVIADGLWLTLPTKENFTALRNSSGSWTLLTALVSAPIAFVIWWFRDTNTLWQIENQRKDTNLKDFQQLSQWASGLHLIEAEKTVTTDEKKTSETIKTSLVVTMNSNDILKPPSRAEGAASLQIAAVYQLQAFLRGDYGKHFQRPAFALLKTVWLSVVQTHVKGWQEEFSQVLGEGKKATLENKIPYRIWKQDLKSIFKSSLAIAINDALTREHGKALQDHKDDLPQAIFSGVRSTVLELEAIDLHQIKMQGADLSEAQLQGADLSEAQLQGADLNDARLQSTNLSQAQLQGANLKYARLQSADLTFARMQGADISHARMQGADLFGAQLQSANLFGAQLQNADLFGAQLQGANLFRAQVDGATFDKQQLAYLTLSDKQRKSIIVTD